MGADSSAFTQGSRMARYRRRKAKGLVEEALAAHWSYGAVVAGLCAVVAIGLPAVVRGHFMLEPLGTTFSFVAWLAACAFGGIAAIRYFRGRPAVEPLQPCSEPRVRGLNEGSPSATPQPMEKPSEWALDVIDRVEWKRFEDLCCAYFREKGIRAETTRLGADGGIDIHLFQDTADPQCMTSVVQCKAWSQPVGVKPVRELRGVMAHAKVDKAFFMAPNGYTDDAKAFAKENRISLLDGAALLMMIQRLPEDARKRLLDLATAGDWTTPTCPSCGNRMTARKSRTAFWGCSTYPKCDAKLPMRAVRARAEFAPRPVQPEGI